MKTAYRGGAGYKDFMLYFAQFHKFFADNYLKMMLWGVFQVNQNHYVVEMANGYATVWEIDWEVAANIGEKMETIECEFNADGELIGVLKLHYGETRFRGKFVKVLTKIGVQP